MEIVDGQGHVNGLGSDWNKVDPAVVVERVVVAMDAVGINALVIDEWAGFDDKMRFLPGNVLPNGAMRSTSPFSDAAVRMYPKRFSYLDRVDPQDPLAEELIARKRKTPGLVALRIVAVPGSGHTELFESGAYEKYFAAAQENKLPVFCQFPERTPKFLAPYAKKFSKLQIIIDHCGTWQKPASGTNKADQLPLTLEMAQFPNVALKWCHAPRDLSNQVYPFTEALGHLKSALKAFGPERVMWACDTTISSKTHSWAQGLYYILDSDLSQTEKEWVLGKTVRKLLDWPRPAT